MFFGIIILAAFFAMNMGGANFAASFGAGCGSRLITKRRAAWLFLFCVVLGAELFGKNVAHTLGQGLVPVAAITPRTLVIIFFSAGLSMFVANRLKIPQSTSFVTVAAITGVGAYVGNVNWATVAFLVPFWIGLPLLSYGLTRWLTSLVYPPRSTNFWFYERYANHEKKLKAFVIISSCYNAFSVGSNNVANVVGPLLNVQSLSMPLAFSFYAAFFGIGAFVFSEPLKTAGEKFVPLGLLTASIIALVSGTLMIIASVMGVPQSFVMLQMGAVLAVSSLKHGSELTFNNPLTHKILYTWTINPILTFILTYVLCGIFL